MKQLFLLLLFASLTNVLLAQTDYFPTQHYELKTVKINRLLPINTFPSSISSTPSIMKNHTVNVSVYSYEDLAIFCKLEVKMEKASGFPVKFRLGEVNYVEKLEGKPYSIYY